MLDGEAECSVPVSNISDVKPTGHNMTCNSVGV